MAQNPILEKGLEWLSRTIAIMVIMVGPGLLGNLLDRHFGYRFLTPIGLIVGGLLGTYVLLLLARKLTPPARGKPLPIEDEKDLEHGEHDDKRSPGSLP